MIGLRPTVDRDGNDLWDFASSTELSLERLEDRDDDIDELVSGWKKEASPPRLERRILPGGLFRLWTIAGSVGADVLANSIRVSRESRGMTRGRCWPWALSDRCSGLPVGGGNPGLVGRNSLRPADDEDGEGEAGVGAPNTELEPPWTAIGAALAGSQGDGCPLGAEVDIVPIDPTEPTLCLPTTVLLEKELMRSC